METVRIGQVVKSVSGHDSGRLFVVVKIESDKFVWLADGAERKLDKPKKKNIKHVLVTAHFLEKISVKLNENSKIFDAELKKALSLIV